MKNPSNFLFMALMAAGIFLAPVQGHAAYSIYLKLSGLQGESSNPVYSNQIVVLSFSNSVTTTITPGTRTTTPPTFSDLTITKYLDVSSPALFLDCSGGHVFSGATLTFQDPATNAAPFYTIKLTDVIITGVHGAGSAGDDNRPTEIMKLNYSTISWNYQQVDTTSGNSIGSPVTHSWDLSDNIGDEGL